MFFCIFMSQRRADFALYNEDSNSRTLLEHCMGLRDKYYIGRCLNGHPDDFRYLVREYQAMLLAHLAGRLGDRDRVEEAAQESFVRAYFKLDKLRKPESFFSWLVGISSRVVKEHRRKEQRNGEIAGMQSEQVRDRPACEDYGLEQAIAKLPGSYRKVVLLRYYGGRSCSEVAEQLDMPLGTVTKTLSRAYATLRQLLQERKNSGDFEVQK